MCTACPEAPAADMVKHIFILYLNIIYATLFSIFSLTYIHI